MHFGYLSLAAAIAVLLSSCDYRSRYESCTFTSPPAEAQRIKTADAEYLVFPGNITGDYTGCQKAWLSNGHLQTSLKYTNGLVTTVEFIDADATPQACLFRYGELLEGDEAVCLPYKRWKFSSKQAN